MGSRSKPRSNVTGEVIAGRRWSPDSRMRSAADHRHTWPGEWPGVWITSQARPSAVKRSSPCSQVVGSAIEGNNGIQSRRIRKARARKCQVTGE